MCKYTLWRSHNDQIAWRRISQNVSPPLSDAWLYYPPIFCCNLSSLCKVLVVLRHLELFWRLLGLTLGKLLESIITESARRCACIILIAEADAESGKLTADFSSTPGVAGVGYCNCVSEMSWSKLHVATELLVTHRLMLVSGRVFSGNMEFHQEGRKIWLNDVRNIRIMVGLMQQ